MGGGGEKSSSVPARVDEMTRRSMRYAPLDRRRMQTAYKARERGSSRQRPRTRNGLQEGGRSPAVEGMGRSSCDPAPADAARREVPESDHKCGEYHRRDTGDDCVVEEIGDEEHDEIDRDSQGQRARQDERAGPVED